MSVATSTPERSFGSIGNRLNNLAAMTDSSRLVSSRRSSSSASYETQRKSSDGEGAGMSDGGRVRRKRRSRIPVRHSTGLYVHSSPPTVIPVHPSIVRQWLRGGEINRLQEIVLNKKIEDLHDAARAGKIENVETILRSEPRINLELSKDGSGTGILHKAVIHGHVPLQDWLLNNYPRTVEVLDKEKRNPLHYAGGNETVWNRLVAGGADTSTADREGYSPAFYMNHPRRLRPPAPDSRTKPTASNQSLVVKPSNIRIWIHDKDLGRLQRVLWEGLGDKLKTETSSQPLVRRFLNAVPYIMGSIRDVHTAAVNNDVELLLSKSSDPVPKEILLSKDANGLTALHKAAGLGNVAVAEAIIRRAPEAVNAKDNLDRTPLHYAGAARDDSKSYQLLVDSDAVDHIEDKKGNTPSYYRAKPADLDGAKLLHVIPDAPRTAHIFPPSWDWRLLTGETILDTPLTSPQVESIPPMASSDPDPDEVSNLLEKESADGVLSDSEVKNENVVDRGTVAGAEDVPLGISDDEGVGSEVNPSVENTSTPISDNVNEEDDEISGARLGETVTLSSSLFRSKASMSAELGNGVDSGNEEGDGLEIALASAEMNDTLDRNGTATQRAGSATSDNASPPVTAEVDPDTYDVASLNSSHAEEAKQSHQGNPVVGSDSIPSEVHDGSSTSESGLDPQLNDEEGTETNAEEVNNEALARNGAAGEQKDPENIVELGDAEISTHKIASSPNSNQSLEAEDPPAATESVEGLVDNGGESPDSPGKTVEDGAKSPDILDGTVDKDAAPDASANLEDKDLPKEEQDPSEISPKTPQNQNVVPDRVTPNSLTNSPQIASNDEISTSENQNQNTNSSRPSTRTIKRSSHGSGSKTAKSNGRGSIIGGEDQETGDSVDEVEQGDSALDESPPDEDSARPSSGDPTGIPVDNEDQQIPLSGDSEGNIERDEEETHLIDRPISTRSAGGSRAEILAITPATPEESDGLDDRKTVEDGSSEEDRAEADDLVAAGDMESMAEMVLNGRGAALLNMSSSNPDVQLFIDNIPQYIAKIERVHTAAREGDLRGVQTALDRRKFAVARDNSTPLKPTPLHVAALFGRTSVLRYLAGRFPESMHAQDAAGRTALHYAATLPDNSHFYSLLVTLGADKSIVDNDGHTAEHYLRSNGELTREELLNEYQNRTVPVDTSGLNFNRFSDKVENDKVSSRKDIDDQVLLSKIEACLRLIRTRASDTLLNRVLQEDVFQELKLRSTRLDNSLLDLIAPGVRDIALAQSRLTREKTFTGVAVPDYESYAVFEEILLPLVRQVNGISENEETPMQPSLDFFGSESRDFFMKMNLDSSGSVLKSFTVEVSRNLQVAALPKNLKLSDLEKIEVALTAILTVFYKRNKDNTFIDESGENLGSYYILNEIVDSKEIYEDLKEDDLLADGINEPDGDNWPYGRGVFISPYGDVTAWVNVREHLKLFSITSSARRGAVGEAYVTAADVINLIEEKLEVKRDPKLGYLTSDPTQVGTALRFKATLNLHNLSRDRTGLRKLCSGLGLVLKQQHKVPHFRVYSTGCLGTTEIDSFRKYVNAITVIIEAEKSLAKGSLMQIPNLIRNLLHKK